jgi:hypothetical protein
MPRTSYNAVRNIAIVLFIVALAVLALPQLWYPLWFDQGAFAACADVIRRGGVMYRDCWEVRGPLAAFAYVIPKVLSISPVFVHGFDLLCAAGTSVLIGLLVRELFGSFGEPLSSPLPSLAAGGLYWLMYASLNYWSTAQAEGFANLFLVAAAYTCWRALNREDWEAEYYSGSRFYALLVMSGVCSALAFWFKYPFALVGVLLCVFIVLWSPVAAARALGFFVVGALSVLLIGLLYFAVNGAFNDWALHVEYDIATFHSVPWFERFHWLTGLFWVELTTFMRVGSTPTAGFKDTVPQIEFLGRGYPFIMLLIVIGAVRTLRSPQHRRAGIFVLAYLLIAIFINIWQGHSYRYHFVIWLPPMALLASAALVTHDEPAQRLLGRGARQIAGQSYFRFVAPVLMGLAALGLTVTMLPWVSDAYTNAFVERKRTVNIYMESKLADYIRISAYLNQNTTPNESVFVFSDVPAVYANAQRPNATRFPYLRWVTESGSAQVRQAYEEALLADLKQTPPKFFVLTKDGFPWPEAKFGDVLKQVPAVNQFFMSNYYYVTDVGQFVVFQRK